MNGALSLLHFCGEIVRKIRLIESSMKVDPVKVSETFLETFGKFQG